MNRMKGKKEKKKEGDWWLQGIRICFFFKKKIKT